MTSIALLPNEALVDVDGNSWYSGDSDSAGSHTQMISTRATKEVDSLQCAGSVSRDAG